MPSHSAKKQRRRRRTGIRELDNLGLLFPAENPEGVQSARPESPVETATGNIYEVLSQIDDRNEPRHPPSRQPSSIDQDPLLRPHPESEDATRAQQICLTPGSLFETPKGEVQSQVCGEEAQAAQEGQGSRLLETQPKMLGPPSVATFAFEFRPGQAWGPDKAGSYLNPPTQDSAVEHFSFTEGGSIHRRDSGISMCSTPRSVTMPPPNSMRPCSPSPPSERPQTHRAPYERLPLQAHHMDPMRQQESCSSNTQRCLSHYANSPWTGNSPQLRERSFPVRSDHLISGPSNVETLSRPMASRHSDGQSTVPPGFEAYFPPEIPRSAASAAAATAYSCEKSSSNYGLTSNKPPPAQQQFYPSKGSTYYPQNTPNPFLPQWPSPKPRQLTVPLPKRTRAMKEAWENGNPLPLSANANHTRIRAPGSIPGHKYPERQDSILTPATTTTEAAGTYPDDPAILQANLKRLPTEMDREDNSGLLFHVARRAEEERLAEKRLNEYLFGTKKIPGLGHNITEVSKEELPPNDIYSEDITYGSRHTHAHAGPGQDEENPLFVERENVEGSDWELVERPT